MYRCSGLLEAIGGEGSERDVKINSQFVASTWMGLGKGYGLMWAGAGC